MNIQREELLERVRETIYAIEPEARIILYGSQARRDARPESDWDFLILIKGPVNDARVDAIRHRLYEIEWETGQVISSIVRSRDKWNSPPWSSTPFFQNVTREGVIL